MADYGKQINEGKTKIIYAHPEDRSRCRVLLKDDITAEDGKKHALMPQKAVICNWMNSNVFRMLENEGLPVAYEAPFDDRSFEAKLCKMYPLEVVVRAISSGSYCKMYPEIESGERLDELVCQFFLKTKDRKWGDLDLPVDDPLIIEDLEQSELRLYDPRKRFVQSEFFATIGRNEIASRVMPGAGLMLDEKQGLALETFELLEGAFAEQGATLIDIKIEFGLDIDGVLRIGDVITPDEMRLLIDGTHHDKQPFRSGELSAVQLRPRYQRVAEITSKF